MWYILWLFGTFFPVLVCCTNKNLATLLQSFVCSLITAFCGIGNKFSPNVTEKPNSRYLNGQGFD
jgi:hypothetical protein